MKIPKTFLPEKCLNEKIAEFSSDKTFETEDINSLILGQNSGYVFSGYVFDTRDMDDVIFKAEYDDFFDLGSVNKKIMIDYEHKIHVHIIQFSNKKSLESNLKGAARIINSYNYSDSRIQYRALFKDEYLVFVKFNWLDIKKPYLKFINAYKNLGFEEVKI